MQAYSNRPKSQLKELFIYQRLGLLPNQKNIFLALACDFDYLSFVMGVISKIDGAILVIIDSSSFKVRHHTNSQHIGNPAYDRFVRHARSVYADDLSTLIHIAHAIVLPKLSALNMNHNDFLMKVIMKFKPIVKSEVHNAEVPAILENNTINIPNHDHQGWIKILSELISYPEDAADFAYIAQSRTIEHQTIFNQETRYEIAI